MRDLTHEELHALQNLADKSSGAVTAFVRIADAQRLTDMGLASRSQQGWDITPAGGAHLSRLGPDLTARNSGAALIAWPGAVRSPT